MPTTSPTGPRQPSAETRTPPAAATARRNDTSAQRGPLAAPTGRGRSGNFAEIFTRGSAIDGKGARLPAKRATDLATARMASSGATLAGTAAKRNVVEPGHEATATKERAPRVERDECDRSLLAPFLPPPSILGAPLSTAPAAVPTPSSAPARAEAAALADRLVRSMRVGKVGRDGHEVRLRLDVGARADVEVRLRHVDGSLTATLVSDSAGHADAERLAGALRDELAVRGIHCEEVSVTLG